MESIMTISLSKELADTHKPRAIRSAAGRIRMIVAKSAKVDGSMVSIDTAVNNYILSTAIKNRSKVKLSVTKSGDSVKVALYGVKVGKKPEQQDAKAKQKPAAPEKKAEDKKQEPASPSNTANPAQKQAPPKQNHQKPVPKEKQGKESA